MHEAVRRLACFAGATVLGDGRVALILSIEGVARHAAVRYDVAPPAADAGGGPEAEAHAVLLFRYGPQEQFAVPLASCAGSSRSAPTPWSASAGRSSSRSTACRRAC